MLSKEEIFEVLADWNFWDKPLPTTSSRPDYENEISRKSASGEIVVLKGVRRSGKSTLLINIMKGLLGDGQDIRNVLYIMCCRLYCTTENQDGARLLKFPT